MRHSEGWYLDGVCTERSQKKGNVLQFIMLFGRVGYMGVHSVIFSRLVNIGIKRYCKDGTFGLKNSSLWGDIF